MAKRITKFFRTIFQTLKRARLQAEDLRIRIESIVTIQSYYRRYVAAKFVKNVRIERLSTARLITNLPEGKLSAYELLFSLSRLQ